MRILIVLVVCARLGLAQTSFVRVSQVGYEAGENSFRAYLMTKAPVSGERFNVVNSEGVNAYTGAVGALLGTWAHSKTVTYDVYALDFDVPGGDLYTIS
ncbi:MAG: cellulase N-terminal Ig-like domain-containing protein, partial [Terriglobales bacterium]